MASWSSSKVNGAQLTMAIGYTVSGSSASVTVTINYHTDATHTVAWNGAHLSVQGSQSYSGSVNINQMSWADQWQQVYQKTTSVALKYGATTSFSISASVTGVNANGGMNPSISGSVSLPAIPYSKPAAPSGVSARYESDTKIIVSASAASSTAAPVSSVLIDRATDGGSFSRVTSLSGAGAKTWTDSGVSAGHFYQYRVSVQGAGGTSSSVNTAVVYTTPLAPSNVQAVKTADNDIGLSWVNTGRGSYETVIREGETVLARVGQGVASYVVSAPSALAAHTYSVAHVAGGRESARAVSNSVQLASAPYAPTLLAPNGAYSAVDTPVVFSWQHNPSDTSPQKIFEIEYRVGESQEWNILARQKTPTSSYTWNSAHSEGVMWWRVRTWGQDASKPSPWSEAAIVTIVSKPEVAITTPSAGVAIQSSRTNIVFVTAAATPYTWEIAVTGAADVALSGQSTGAQTVTGVDRLANGKNANIVVRVLDKVWSDWVQVSAPVTYPAPPAPSVTVERVWDETIGAYAVEVSWECAMTGVEKDAVDVTVERIMPDGSSERAGEGLPVSGQLVDYLAHPTETTVYRVTARNILDQTVAAQIQCEAVPPQRGVLLAPFSNTGAVGLLYNVNVEYSNGLENASLYHMLGASLPTMVAGTQYTDTVKVSGLLVEEDVMLTKRGVRERWEGIIRGASPVMYCDPSGLRMPVSISQLCMSRDRERKVWEVSFTATRVMSPSLVVYGERSTW